MTNSSFRDPSGYVFEDEGVVYRRVNDVYTNTLAKVKKCGLYQDLVDNDLMIPFEVIDSHTIRPEQLDFVSYPYEWCFSALKDAALVTLEIARRALTYEMVLKDASAYNIQFYNGKPLLIDHLSFEPYEDRSPWKAYKQFCEHFLAPLLLIRKDYRLGQLLKSYIDGIPLDLTCKLLPMKTWLHPLLFIHIKMHAMSQRKYANTSTIKGNISKVHLLNLLESLRTCITNLNYPKMQTTWSNYTSSIVYTETKKASITKALQELKPATVWDLGANTGEYSRLAANLGISVIALESDMSCVEESYNRKHKAVLSLVSDLTNPSPSIGWSLTERKSLLDRKSANVVLAVALVHHLAISNNVPLPRIAKLLSSLGHHLIIEFISKDDDKVKKLLATRKDIFTNYTKEGFEDAFSAFYNILSSEDLNDSRKLYTMEIKA